MGFIVTCNNVSLNTWCLIPSLSQTRISFLLLTPVLSYEKTGKREGWSYFSHKRRLGKSQFLFFTVHRPLRYGPPVPIVHSPPPPPPSPLRTINPFRWYLLNFMLMVVQCSLTNFSSSPALKKVCLKPKYRAIIFYRLFFLCFLSSSSLSVLNNLDINTCSVFLNFN